MPTVKNKFKFENERSTREKLTKVALELFARQGYDGTSTKQICDAAGANIAAVTYHFETKEKLLNTLLSEQLSEDGAALAGILKEAHSIEEFKVRLRMYCEAVVNLRLKNPDFHRLVLLEAPKNERAFATFKSGVLQFEKNMLVFLKDAKKKGFIGAGVEISVVGFMIVSLLNGPAIDRIVSRVNPEFDLSDPKKLDAYLDRVLRIVFHGLIKEGKSL